MPHSSRVDFVPAWCAQPEQPHRPAQHPFPTGSLPHTAICQQKSLYETPGTKVQNIAPRTILEADTVACSRRERSRKQPRSTICTTKALARACCPERTYLSERPVYTGRATIICSRGGAYLQQTGGTVSAGPTQGRFFCVIGLITGERLFQKLNTLRGELFRKRAGVQHEKTLSKPFGSTCRSGLPRCTHTWASNF